MKRSIFLYYGTFARGPTFKINYIFSLKLITAKTREVNENEKTVKGST
jgi:hypothetical protein